MMVGRDLGDIYKNLDRDKMLGEVLLDVRGISSDFVKENSFQLRAGEVLGFSGLVGAGRTELMRAIIGADRLRTGEVLLEGKPIRCRSPKEAMDNGLKSFAAVSKNMQAIAAEATEYSKKAFENGSVAVEKMFAAKSPEKALEVQADYMKQAYEGFVAQASKLGELYAEMAKDAYKPFESLVVKAK